MKHVQLPCRNKKFFKKEVVSLKVEIKHTKRENYKINERHKQVNKKLIDLEEETMETFTEEKVFTKFDFACIGDISILNI